jgi:hypothetical protein
MHSTFAATFLTTYAKNAEVGRCYRAALSDTDTTTGGILRPIRIYLLSQFRSPSPLIYQHILLSTLRSSK